MMEEDLLIDGSDPLDSVFATMKNLLKEDPPYRFTKVDIENVQSVIREVTDRLKVAKTTCITSSELLEFTDDNFSLSSSERSSDDGDLNEEFGSVDFQANCRITGSTSSENYASSCEERDFENDDIPKNTNHVNYGRFISKEKSFLRMKTTKPFDPLVNREQLKYPLGVVYDEVKKIWIVCEKDDKLIQIDEHSSDSIVLEHRFISNPSALTVLKEGHSVAVLCSKSKYDYWITEYNYGTRHGKMTKLIRYDNKKHELRYPCRGLSRSYAGNILTIDTPPAPKCPRLRLFAKNGKGSASFDILKSRRPSFIASNRKQVAVSDLGTQRVFIFEVDDEGWKDGSINLDIKIIHIIGDENLSYARLPKKITDLPQFNFVAGVQYDKNGFLIVADAGGHTMKLFGKTYDYLHRVSTDFPVPFMSSFHINRQGRTIIIDLRGKEKLQFAQLASVDKIQPWIETFTKPKPQEPSRFNNKRS